MDRRRARLCCTDRAGVSLATATLEQIAGVNGTTIADVNKDHQLLTAPAAPASLFTLEAGFNTNTNGCFALAPLPAGKAGIGRDLRFDVIKGSASDVLLIYADTTCSGNTLGDMNLAVANGELRFGDGVALPKGGGLSVYLINSSGSADEVDVYADGYTVPSAAVPASATILHGHTLNLRNQP